MAMIQKADKSSAAVQRGRGRLEHKKLVVVSRGSTRTNMVGQIHMAVRSSTAGRACWPARRLAAAAATPYLAARYRSAAGPWLGCCLRRLRQRHHLARMERHRQRHHAACWMPHAAQQRAAHHAAAPPAAMRLRCCRRRPMALHHRAPPCHCLRSWPPPHHTHWAHPQGPSNRHCCLPQGCPPPPPNACWLPAPPVLRPPLRPPPAAAPPCPWTAATTRLRLQPAAPPHPPCSTQAGRQSGGLGQRTAGSS